MLTERQRDVFLYIHRCLTRNKLAPTCEEICKEFGIKSKSQVHAILQALVSRGIIKKYPFYSRGLEIIRVPQYLEGELQHQDWQGIDGENHVKIKESKAEQKARQTYERFKELLKEWKIET